MVRLLITMFALFSLGLVGCQNNSSNAPAPKEEVLPNNELSQGTFIPDASVNQSSSESDNSCLYYSDYIKKLDEQKKSEGQEGEKKVTVIEPKAGTGYTTVTHKYSPSSGTMTVEESRILESVNLPQYSKFSSTSFSKNGVSATATTKNECAFEKLSYGGGYSSSPKCTQTTSGDLSAMYEAEQEFTDSVPAYSGGIGDCQYILFKKGKSSTESTGHFQIRSGQKILARKAYSKSKGRLVNCYDSSLEGSDIEMVYISISGSVKAFLLETGTSCLNPQNVNLQLFQFQGIYKVDKSGQRRAILGTTKTELVDYKF